MGLFQRKFADSSVLEMLVQGGRKANRALDHIYKAIGRPIQQQLRADGATQDEVLDAFQNAVVDFLIAARRPGFAIRESISAWLFTATKHHWLNDRKKSERTAKFAAEITLCYHPYSDQAEARRMHEILEEILSKLDAQCRKILEWTYLDGIDREGVAQLLEFANLNSVSNKRASCLENAVVIGRGKGYFNR